ncbi:MULTISPECIES: FAD-dependent oxidoreductase [Sphingobium]|uniref:FAD-dependent oxidoreductase n=1 Tax=Sphingobium sp. MI1205 TaxID=407020 RepID=UPI00076FE5A8|nr:FAD-dependent oxidoreductase [Sphingobium sp. MI1205]AMK19902.1 fumarate reductase/succinate dehydrogenase flavoprotein domain-containing protein [Sphingobium sp. MI1205]
MDSWDMTADVVVIGSGSAGLSAALSARNQGADVLILERSDKLGGTSAVSGGLPWIPNNAHMHEVGASDSREEALAYLRRLSLGKMDEALCETYVDAAPDVIRFLEAETELEFVALTIPDYHPELEGGKIGRSLTARLFPAGELGELRPALRMSPHFPIPVSLADVADGKTNLLDPAMIADRMAKDLVGTGHALMAGLIKAARDKGIAMRRGVRAQRLVIEDGVVTGLHAEENGRSVRIGARRGVVIASGGFEWNANLVKDFIYGPEAAPLSPPFNEGDGLLMAIEAGAELGNMCEAWYHASVRIPGEDYEGHQLNRLTSAERHSPGSIIVNAQGKRFVNEALSYHDVCLAMRAFDPTSFGFPNARAWVIVHRDYLDKYTFMTRMPGDPIPRWLATGETIRDLAQAIGVDPDGLEDTVARFNANAAKGVDPDFHRGESAYDRYYGDRELEGAFQTLGPLDKAPFFACELRIGTIGTRGGPRVNSRAEVLSSRGGIVPGLYAAGNAMASFTGMSYPGAGGTIGPALTFGHIAGRSAAAGSNRF